jgi:flagellar biosynthesis protein FlhF
MRLKKFAAPTVEDAIRKVRAELGSDAVILDTRRTGRRSYEVTAGLDAPVATPPGAEAELDGLDRIAAALAFHGVPAALADRLLGAAAELDAADATLALAGALDSLFAFRPLLDTGGSATLALVGPPGAGKTATLAKLAMRARLEGRAVGVVSCDLVRAGAEAQLAVYTRRLEIPAYRAVDGDGLARALTALPGDTLRLIDTTGCNPREPRDLEGLARILRQSAAEPLLVLPAGGDAIEMAEQAVAFASLGVARMIATKLDLVRRLGGVLAAAGAGDFAFAESGQSSEIGGGLAPVNPVSLARLLLAASPPATPDPESAS